MRANADGKSMGAMFVCAQSGYKIDDLVGIATGCLNVHGNAQPKYTTPDGSSRW